MVDQLAPAYEFEVRSGMMRDAILFALANGWNPKEKALTLEKNHYCKAKSLRL